VQPTVCLSCTQINVFIMFSYLYACTSTFEPSLTAYKLLSRAQWNRCKFTRTVLLNEVEGTLKWVDNLSALFGEGIGQGIVSVKANVNTHTFTCARARARAHTHTHTNTHTNTYTLVRTHAHTHTYTHIHIHTHLHTCSHKHTRTHTYTHRQLASLRTLASFGKSCGVQNLSLLSRNEVRDLEPEVKCEAALLSPSSGILDSHTYM